MSRPIRVPNSEKTRNIGGYSEDPSKRASMPYKPLTAYHLADRMATGELRAFIKYSIQLLRAKRKGKRK